MSFAAQLPEPEPTTLQLAEIVIVLSGSFEDPNSESAVQFFASQVARFLSEKNLEYSFCISDREITIRDFEVDIASIENGSIRGKLLIAGSILFAAYTAIGTYPAFKDALPVIEKDFTYILSLAAESFKEEHSDKNTHYQNSQIFVLREEDLAMQIGRQEGGEHTFLKYD